jgi:hypothetical protein
MVFNYSLNTPVMITKITGNYNFFATCSMLHLKEQKYTQIDAATLRKSRHTTFLCKVNSSVSTEGYHFPYTYCSHLLILLQDLAKRQTVNR